MTLSSPVTLGITSEHQSHTKKRAWVPGLLSGGEHLCETRSELGLYCVWLLGLRGISVIAALLIIYPFDIMLALQSKAKQNTHTRTHTVSLLQTLDQQLCLVFNPWALVNLSSFRSRGKSLNSKADTCRFLHLLLLLLLVFIIWLKCTHLTLRPSPFLANLL